MSRGLRAGFAAALLIGSAAAATVTATPAVRAAAVAPSAEPGVPFEGLSFDGQPTFQPIALIAPTPRNPWLLIGTARRAPGEPTEAVLYTAESAAADLAPEWQAVLPLGRAAGDDAAAPYTVLGAQALSDGTVVVIGDAERDGTTVTVLWEVADGVVSAPHDVPLPVDAAVVPGGLATDDAGALWLVVEQPGAGYTLAERGPDGRWSTSLIDVAHGQFALSGVAVSGSTVVLVGTDLGGTPSAPQAFVSADRGATFVPASLSERFRPVSFGGSIRAVRRAPDGFYATVCTERVTGPAVSLAYSADGTGWDEVAGVAALDLPQVTAAQCGDLAIDGAGGVWFAPIGGQQGQFLRVTAGAVTARLGYTVADDVELASGNPLLAADVARLMVAVPTFGGTATFAQSADDPAATMLVPTNSPLSGRPSFAGLDTRDDRGAIVTVNAFPQLVALPDGATTWATQTRSYVVFDDGEMLADDAVNVIDVPERRGTPIVVTTPARQVAIVNRTELDAAADPAASGDVAVLVRPTGGSWSSPTPMIQSPGDQFIVDAAVSGDAVVAAGRSTTVDPTDGSLLPAPLVVVGDGVSWQTVVIPAEAADFVVSAVCPATDGTAVLLGRALGTGARMSLRLDIAAATVTAQAAVVADAGPDDLLVECGYNAGDTVRPFVVRTGTAVYASADAVSWDLVHTVEPGWRLRQVAVGGAGVATLANGFGVNSNFAVHVGSSAGDLQPVQSAEFAGPGDQEGSAVSVRGNAVLVYGSVNDRPLLWRIPLAS